MITPDPTLTTLFLRIQLATVLARSKTGDKSISTRVEKGRLQIVRVTYPPELKGESLVKVASRWLPPEKIITKLINMTGDSR